MSGVKMGGGRDKQMKKQQEQEIIRKAASINGKKGIEVRKKNPDYLRQVREAGKKGAEARWGKRLTSS